MALSIKEGLALGKSGNSTRCLRLLQSTADEKSKSASFVCGKPSWDLFVPSGPFDVRCEECAKLPGENKLGCSRSAKSESATPSPTLIKKPRPLIVFGDAADETLLPASSEEVSEMRSFVFDVIRAREEMDAILRTESS